MKQQLLGSSSKSKPVVASPVKNNFAIAKALILNDESSASEKSFISQEEV